MLPRGLRTSRNQGSIMTHKKKSSIMAFASARNNSVVIIHSTANYVLQECVIRKLHPLAYLGIMEAYLRAPLNPSIRQCCDSQRGFRETLNLTAMMPIAASILDEIVAFINAWSEIHLVASELCMKYQQLLWHILEFDSWMYLWLTKNCILIQKVVKKI